MQRVIVLRQKRKRGHLALIERSHNLYTLTGRAPTRRVKNLPVDVDQPSLNFFNSNIVVANSFSASGSVFLNGWFQDRDSYTLAEWKAAEGTAQRNITLHDHQDSDSVVRDGQAPRPLQVVDSGLQDGSYYVVCSDGVVEKRSDSGALLSSSYTDQWQRRTSTPDHVSNPAHTVWGFGFSATMQQHLDLKPWDGQTFTTYGSEAAMPASDVNPGFGKVWWGRLVCIFKFSGRWWGLARGYVYDNGVNAFANSGPNAAYACYGVWQCQAGGDPAVAGNWQIMTNALAPYDVDNLDRTYHGAGKDYSSPFAWLEFFQGTPYFVADPFTPSFSGQNNKAFVYTMDTGGAIPAMQYQDTNCYSGPLAQLGDKLYAVVSNAHTHRLQLFEVDESAPDAPVLASETPYSRPYPKLATALGYGGYVHVALGKDPNIGTPEVYFTVSNGDGDATGWDLVSWNSHADTWSSAPRTFPAAANDDEGLWARLVNYNKSGADYTGSPDPVPPGGGGGTTPPGGADACSAFAMYQASTISRSLWASHMTNSPLLTEHSDPDYWYDKVAAAGINPAVADAFWTKETQWGRVMGQAAGDNNIGNIRDHSWGQQIGLKHTACCGEFSEFATWEDGVEDWIELWTLSIYHYADGTPKSLHDDVFTYAPPLQNDSQAYYDQLCERLQLWAG